MEEQPNIPPSSPDLDLQSIQSRQSWRAWFESKLPANFSVRRGWKPAPFLLAAYKPVNHIDNDDNDTSTSPDQEANQFVCAGWLKTTLWIWLVLATAGFVAVVLLAAKRAHQIPEVHVERQNLTGLPQELAANATLGVRSILLPSLSFRMLITARAV